MLRRAGVRRERLLTVRGMGGLPLGEQHGLAGGLGAREGSAGATGLRECGDIGRGRETLVNTRPCETNPRRDGRMRTQRMNGKGDTNEHAGGGGRAAGPGEATAGAGAAEPMAGPGEATAGGRKATGG